METSTTEKRGGELTLREAILPAKVSDWRAKLSTKAKQEKRFRFYSLYGLIGHAETLKGAWHQVRANGGAAGVDGISIEQIEHQGAEQWLEALGKELREKTYRCAAVRRVYIPKANGKLRPLGIPTVRDRVVQAAVLLILEPIFEADTEPRALRVPRLSNRFGPCEGGPTPPLLAHGAEPQGDEARSGQNLGDDGAQIRMETAARTHRRAKSAPQGLGELLPAWPTTDSLPTDQSLRTATALSAPAPQ